MKQNETFIELVNEALWEIGQSSTGQQYSLSLGPSDQLHALHRHDLEPGELTHRPRAHRNPLCEARLLVLRRGVRVRPGLRGRGEEDTAGPRSEGRLDFKRQKYTSP